MLRYSLFTLLFLCLPCISLSSEAPKVTLAPGDMVVYSGDLQSKWQDRGWSPRDLGRGGPARVQFANSGGWLLGQPQGIVGKRFKALSFAIKAPRHFGDFLEVRLINKDGPELPAVILGPQHLLEEEQQWSLLTVSMQQLNPSGRPFHFVQLRAATQVSRQWVHIDNVALLTRLPRATVAAPKQRVASGADTVEVALGIYTKNISHAINPLVYGLVYPLENPHPDNPAEAEFEKRIAELHPASLLWGGSSSSRYNWRLGKASNSGRSAFFHNGEVRTDWRSFLHQNHNREMLSALTVPLVGWVAKDTTSYAFPVSVFGAQMKVMAGAPDVGSGVGLDGNPLMPGAATQTSVELLPADVTQWVTEIQRLDRIAGRSHISLYHLGHEPMLWHSTHRDVHPQPADYEELLQRTLVYADAIRKVEPEAKIAGPALWGWTAYHHSARDVVHDIWQRPDRIAHGDTPLLAWYIQQTRAHRERTGQRLLDVVDVHFYPQGDGVFGESLVDPDTSALRIRSTRSLWDPSYRDESWIDETIMLLPRLKRLIDENDPGLGISIGSYDFGAPDHISGAIALAEALGRLGQSPHLTAAYYGAIPKVGSPAFYAFCAYRNYDGKGGAFLPNSLLTKSAPQVSLFASANDRGQMVAVVLNLSPQQAVLASVDLVSCHRPRLFSSYRYAQGDLRINPLEGDAVVLTGNTVKTELPPYSITVVELACQLPAEQ